MSLKEKQLAFQILTPCTLNCRLCADYAPAYRERKEYYYVSVENFSKEIQECFQIYDYIDDITITGGEPLLHPDLPEILSHTLINYRSQFSICRIFTNGTILPSSTLIDTILQHMDHNFEFVIDHYGSCSNKADEIITLLKQKKIPVRVNQYFGENQHCGGWIDYGSLSEYRNYSDEKVKKLISNCHNATWKNLLIFKGKLYLCTQCAFGHDLGHFPLKKDEFIDLLDSFISIEEKKRIAAQFGKTPLTACQYCNGFDIEHSKRYPAGEQL